MQTTEISFWKKFHAWVVWGLGALYLLYKYLLETSPSVMGGALMSDFHLSGEQLGNLAASYFYAYLIMQIPMGVFTDRFGPRRVTTLCILSAVAGTLLFSFAPNILVADLGRFLTGVGAAVAALSCLKLTTLWFPPRKFAFMAGLMMCLGMLGAMSAEAPLSLALNVFGWRHSLIYIAALGLILAFVYWLSVRDDGPHAPEPYSLGDTHTQPVWAGLREILKNPQSWWLSLYSGLAFAPVSVLGGLWGVPFLQEAYGFSRTDSAGIISLAFFGFAVGAPLWGWLADRIGHRKPLMWMGTILALVAIALVLYQPDLSAIECRILMFMFGFTISTFLLCFTMIRQVNRLILAATAIGFMNSFDALLGAVTDPFIGWLLDLGWKGRVMHNQRIFGIADYHIALVTMIVYLVSALLLLFLIKETYDTQK